MDNEISFEDLQAAHAAELAAVAQRTEDSLAAAEQMRIKALDADAAARADAAAKLSAEVEVRSRKLADFANNKLSGPVAAWCVSGSREAARDVAEALQIVHRETLRQLGRQFYSRGEGVDVLGPRLWISFVSALLKRDPGALGCFADETCGISRMPGAVDELDRATRACIDTKAAPSEVESALRAIESSVATVARGNRGVLPDSQDRFDLHRKNAARAPIESGFKALDAAAKQRAIEASEDHQTQVRRARLGANDPSWLARYGAGWADSIRKVSGRLVVRDDGRITPA